MDVLLINGRGATAAPHESSARAAALASGLSESGHRVRWLCLLAGAEIAPAVAPAVAVQHLRHEPHPFRAVQRRLGDAAAERALTEELRSAPPDVVHLLATGNPMPAALSWIANRLGVPVVVEVELAEALCHRGTLVDETGAHCDRWDDPDRCTSCCRTPFAGGLSRVEGWASRLLRPLGGLAPFPSRTDFLNRLDLVVHSLLHADVVLVDTDDDAEQLVRAGVARRAIVPGRRTPEPEAWLERYELARRARARVPANE